MKTNPPHKETIPKTLASSLAKNETLTQTPFTRKSYMDEEHGV